MLSVAPLNMTICFLRTSYERFASKMNRALFHLLAIQHNGLAVE